MASFTVDFFSSLDGNGSARGWPGYWGKEGPELREDRVHTFAQDQVLVFGATTFREFRKFVVEYDEPYYDKHVAEDRVLKHARRAARVAELDTRQRGRGDGGRATEARDGCPHALPRQYLS